MRAEAKHKPAGMNCSIGRGRRRFTLTELPVVTLFNEEELVPGKLPQPRSRLATTDMLSRAILQSSGARSAEEVIEALHRRLAEVKNMSK